MNNQGATYRLSFDIGGTFTDIVLAGSDGSIHTTKVLSNHEELVRPIVEGLSSILGAGRVDVSQIAEVVVGASTIVTNLIIERKGVHTGLITTEGFRDVIDIGREMRYDVYDLSAPFPARLVSCGMREEIKERIDYLGHVLQEPSDLEIEEVVRRLRSSGAQAIAVCLLHSYRNGVHEERVKSMAAKIAPEIPISLSSEVAGEIREYERTIATVLNAYVMPKVGNYFGEIERGLKDFGVNCTLQLMQSNGGLITREVGERAPIRMLESGPAAGALGAAHAARRAERPQTIAFDMGGTTAKTCLISKGQPGITHEFEAARERRFSKGSGLPVRLPTVDLIEIGAGGGSIAYVDEGGLLKVGPRSAGSMPGPACYGLGGIEPTVTDAALLLGYLDARGSLSGRVDLRLDLAEKAIQSRLAAVLGMSVIEAANGIHRIVCEHMASAVKAHAAEKGIDLRRHTLLAFGGAGPLHAREVALRCGCHEILVPANAGVFSAVGLLVAPLKVDMVRSRFTRLDVADWNEVETLYAQMERQLEGELLAAGASREAIKFRRLADMRYAGQGFEATADMPESFGAANTDSIAERFHAVYERQFGHRLQGRTIEAVNWRVEAFAEVGAKNLGSQTMTMAGSRELVTRPAYFPRIKRFVETTVLRSDQLEVLLDYHGPGLIEQAGTTAVVGPDDRYWRDQAGNLHIVLAA